MFIYKITNTVNGMAYIGATLKSVTERMSRHWSAAKSGKNTLLAVAIRTFGRDAFRYETIDTAATVEELQLKEIQAILINRTLHPNGYNVASGGLMCVDARHLNSTREKIAAKARGRVVSEEQRAKLSASLKGKIPWNRGIHTGPSWNKGLRATDEARASMRAAWSRRENRHPNQRQIDYDGVTYASVSEASRRTGLTRSQLKYRLKNGGAKYCDGNDMRTGIVPANARAFEYEGTQYESVADASRKTGVPLHQLRYRLKTGAARYLDGLPIKEKRPFVITETSNNIGARYARRTVCHQCGGPFSVFPNGIRYCKPCRNKKMSEAQRKRRALAKQLTQPESSAANAPSGTTLQKENSE